MVNAALVVPALRRCGAPRGAAAAAAILFAASPAALETTAWLTNQCSLFAGVFAAAAIATIPFGRPRAARMALPALLAGLAFLSKEETFLLPALAVLVLARFRVRRLPRAALAAWPLFLVLGAVVAARAWMLGGLGGHRDPASHQSQLFLGWMSGPRAALESEAPARYFLPMRISLFPEGPIVGLRSSRSFCWHTAAAPRSRAGARRALSGSRRSRSRRWRRCCRSAT